MFEKVSVRLAQAWLPFRCLASGHAFSTGFHRRTLKTLSSQMSELIEKAANIFQALTLMPRLEGYMARNGQFQFHAIDLSITSLQPACPTPLFKACSAKAATPPTSPTAQTASRQSPS